MAVCRIWRRQSVLDHAAVLVNLDRTKTNWRARTFALTLLCIELAVFDNDARANDFSIAAHVSYFLLPFARISQTSWSRLSTTRSLDVMFTSSSKERLVNCGGTSTRVLFEG